MNYFKLKTASGRCEIFIDDELVQKAIEENGGAELKELISMLKAFEAKYIIPNS